MHGKLRQCRCLGHWDMYINALLKSDRIAKGIVYMKMSMVFAKVKR